MVAFLAEGVPKKQTGRFWGKRLVAKSKVLPQVALGMVFGRKSQKWLDNLGTGDLHQEPSSPEITQVQESKIDQGHVELRS